MEDNNVQSLIEFVRATHGAELRNVSDGVNVLVLPEGMAAYSVKKHIDEYLEHPERRLGTAKFFDLSSIIEHANRFKSDHSALFALPGMDAPSITSVLDYHDSGHAGTPRFCRHRGVYEFPLSPEWQAWMAVDGKRLSQVEFAEFLEDRILDISTSTIEANGTGAMDLTRAIGGTIATPSDLMNLSRGLKVHVASRVEDATNLSSGEVQLRFEEQHKGSDGKPLVVPTGFLIAIPVFRYGPLYVNAVRLRYRLNQGNVTWIMQIHRPDISFRHAFDESCEKAKTDTGLPLFLGAPEA